MSEDDDRPDDKQPSFSDAFAAAAQKSGLGKINPGEMPSARSVLGAVGGVRGIIESTLPGIAFLVLYLVTKSLLPSVLVPVAIALIFVVARVGARQAYTSALTGAVGLALTAVLALLTNNAVTNFVPGVIINAVGAVVLLISLIVRWPLIGVLVGLLLSDSDWRGNDAKRRILTAATWLWVGLFVVRLVAEVPLLLAGLVSALAIVRLITSVPLYAVCLWITWLLVRSVYSGDKVAD